MPDGIPTLPRWTDPSTGRFSAGRAFGNILDAIVPFDIYNSQTGMYNRNNAIAGGLSMVNPVAGLGAYAYMNRDQFSRPAMPQWSNPFRDWLAGRTGNVGRGVQDPLRFVDDSRGISGRAMEHEFDFRRDVDNRNSRIAALTSNTPGYSSTQEWLSGGGGGRSDAGATGRYGGSARLGAGALGSAGDAALQQYIQSLHSRGGTMQER